MTEMENETRFSCSLQNFALCSHRQVEVVLLSCQSHQAQGSVEMSAKAGRTAQLRPLSNTRLMRARVPTVSHQAAVTRQSQAGFLSVTDPVRSGPFEAGITPRLARVEQAGSGTTAEAEPLQRSGEGTAQSTGCYPSSQPRPLAVS